MKKHSRIKLIYTRYILPPVLLLLTFLTMLIPSYRYVTDGKLGEAVSPLKLLATNFDSARKVVFAATEQNAANLLFSRTALALIILFWLMFFIAFAVSLYSLWIWLLCASDKDGSTKEKSRTLFVTLIPNRIILCALYALSLPIMLFPYLLPSLCESIYSQRVGMALIAPDALIAAALCFIATVVLCIVSATSERTLGFDVFKKRKAFETSESDYTDSIPDTENADEEQNEMIRRILLGKENNENNEKTED